MKRGIKRLCSSLRYYLDIFLEKLERLAKETNHGSLHLGSDLKTVTPPNRKLPTGLERSVSGSYRTNMAIHTDPT